MYQSPKDLIRDLAPDGAIPFDWIGKMAGILYLLSVILPSLSNSLGFGRYSPAAREQTFLFSVPYNPELSVFAVTGTLVGPVETATGTENVGAGIFLGLVDLVLGPVLWLGLPIAGVGLTLLPVLIGGVLLTGYKNHILLFGIGYLMSYMLYVGMLSIKAISFGAHAGAYLCLIATLLILFAAIDRIHKLDLLSNNGY
jgi:hypothetical protein